MKSISVTDLKNHLSAGMKRVRAGESLLVTDRRKPVAILSPLAEAGQEEWLRALVADGIVKPPQSPLDVKRFVVLPRAVCEEGLMSAVNEDREER